MSLSRTRLVFWYAPFAAISIGANLGSQSLAFHLYQGPYAVPLSVCAGTGVGLVVKYLLRRSGYSGMNTKVSHTACAHSRYTLPWRSARRSFSRPWNSPRMHSFMAKLVDSPAAHWVW